jgi:ATP-dependent helicase/nuclease subunit A
VPDWLRRAAAHETPAIRTLTPSSPEAPVVRAPSPDAAQALLRGSLTHRLLQSLPDVSAERREQAAHAFLARAGRDLDAEQQARIAEQVLRIVAHSDFAALFGPGSRAEVPLVGRLTAGDETVRVSGQIDRLVVSPEDVLIADFKSDHVPPARIEDVPPGYVRQLALYRALLMQLYPGRPVRAALVWTEVPELMELSPLALDTALAAAVKPA